MESGYTPSDWVSLCNAEIGAAAALAGLVFVGVSINLERIMRYALLPDRALEAVLLFGTILLASTFVLVPGQSVVALGIELFGLGVVASAAVTAINVRALRSPGAAGYKPTLLRFTVLSELAVLSFALAGLTLALHAGGGLYWLVPGTALALLAGVASAWVLLVEIMR